MNEIVQELLPYAKGFAGFYLIGNIIASILTIGVFICVFRYILKRHREFDEKFKCRWK